MPSSQLSAMQVRTKAIGAKHGGAVKPFQPPLHMSATAALGGLIPRQWDRETLRGPVAQYVESRILPRLGLAHRINWSTVLTLAFNFAIWLFVVITLSIVIE